MNNYEIIALVDHLRAHSSETEWLEFKANRFVAQELGEYLSALANAACIFGKPKGYLIFGINDASHDVVGTTFDPHIEKAKGNQDLIIWLTIGLDPRVSLRADVVQHPDGRVVVFQVGAASNRPVKFYGKSFIRIGTSKTELGKHPELERTIWNKGTDWTAQICNNATISDLDPAAISKAKSEFCTKNPRQIAQVGEWDDLTFLNKARIAIQGRITNAALLLLGRPETAPLLSPAVAKISWILRDTAGLEKDYEHFGPPFILQVDQILSRIRNLTLRTLPSGTLFPQEISQYDPWVIREALHNSIAHQDYLLHGRINVVETPNSVMLSNVGSFLPGDVQTVIRQDAPLEIYRNPFLAEAMVNLNMIDTQGGGIKRMFQAQVKRFFPLPDYDLSSPDRVSVTIRGEILDERYTRLLMSRSDLNLWDVVLLDKVQKRVSIDKDDHQRLKKMKLVEGRYPNLIVASNVARMTGQPARHIRQRGFDKQYYLDLILALLREHSPVSRRQIDDLLLDKLPEVMTEKQKKTKIHNLLTELKKSRLVVNNGSRSKPAWQLTRH